MSNSPFSVWILMENLKLVILQPNHCTVFYRSVQFYDDCGF